MSPNGNDKLEIMDNDSLVNKGKDIESNKKNEVIDLFQDDSKDLKRNKENTYKLNSPTNNSIIDINSDIMDLSDSDAYDNSMLRKKQKIIPSINVKSVDSTTFTDHTTWIETFEFTIPKRNIYSVSQETRILSPFSHAWKGTNFSTLLVLSNNVVEDLSEVKEDYENEIEKKLNEKKIFNNRYNSFGLFLGVEEGEFIPQNIITTFQFDLIHSSTPSTDFDSLENECSDNVQVDYEYLEEDKYSYSNLNGTKKIVRTKTFKNFSSPLNSPCSICDQSNQGYQSTTSFPFDINTPLLPHMFLADEDEEIIIKATSQPRIEQVYYLGDIQRWAFQKGIVGPQRNDHGKFIYIPFEYIDRYCIVGEDIKNYYYRVKIRVHLYSQFTNMTLLNSPSFQNEKDKEEIKLALEQEKNLNMRENLHSSNQSASSYQLKSKTSYNSRKSIDMVGLENSGATCYLNSLLQILFHLNLFRKEVYQLPLVDRDLSLKGLKSENDVTPPSSSIIFGVQQLFYAMQTQNFAVNTKMLTSAFGWSDDEELHEQQDVQEMMRLLLSKIEDYIDDLAKYNKKISHEKDEEKVEEKGKSTNLVKNLFCGKLKSKLKCVDVEYESIREEDFYDLQLDLHRHHDGHSPINSTSQDNSDNPSNAFTDPFDLYHSLHHYFRTEILEGENQYQHPTHGLTNASKTISITHLPPIMTLQLKRFVFDESTYTFVKNHDMCKFPLVLDMKEFIEKDSSESSEDIVCTKYVLNSVLVHSGEVNSGHYYSYIRPFTLTNFSDVYFNPSNDIYTQDSISTSNESNNLKNRLLVDPYYYHYHYSPPQQHHCINNTQFRNGQWFKFNDESVFEVNPKEAIEYCYGRSCSYDDLFKDENGQNYSHLNHLLPNTFSHYLSSNTNIFSSAYMLIYIRMDQARNIMQPVTENHFNSLNNELQFQSYISMIGHSLNNLFPSSLLNHLRNEHRLQVLYNQRQKMISWRINVGLANQGQIRCFTGYSKFHYFLNSKLRSAKPIFSNDNGFSIDFDGSLKFSDQNNDTQKDYQDNDLLYSIPYVMKGSKKYYLLNLISKTLKIPPTSINLYSLTNKDSNVSTRSKVNASIKTFTFIDSSAMKSIISSNLSEKFFFQVSDIYYDEQILDEYNEIVSLENKWLANLKKKASIAFGIDINQEDTSLFNYDLDDITLGCGIGSSNKPLDELELLKVDGVDELREEIKSIDSKFIAFCDKYWTQDLSDNINLFFRLFDPNHIFPVLTPSESITSEFAGLSVNSLDLFKYILKSLKSNVVSDLPSNPTVHPFTSKSFFMNSLSQSLPKSQSKHITSYPIPLKYIGMGSFPQTTPFDELTLVIKENLINEIKMVYNNIFNESINLDDLEYLFSHVNFTLYKLDALTKISEISFLKDKESLEDYMSISHEKAQISLNEYYDTMGGILVVVPSYSTELKTLIESVLISINSEQKCINYLTPLIPSSNSNIDDSISEDNEENFFESPIPWIKQHYLSRRVFIQPFHFQDAKVVYQHQNLLNIPRILNISTILSIDITLPNFMKYLGECLNVDYHHLAFTIFPYPGDEFEQLNEYENSYSLDSESIDGLKFLEVEENSPDYPKSPSSKLNQFQEIFHHEHHYLHHQLIENQEIYQSASNLPFIYLYYHSLNDSSLSSIVHMEDGAISSDYKIDDEFDASKITLQHLIGKSNFSYRSIFIYYKVLSQPLIITSPNYSNIDDFELTQYSKNSLSTMLSESRLSYREYNHISLLITDSKLRSFYNNSIKSNCFHDYNPFIPCENHLIYLNIPKFKNVYIKDLIEYLRNELLPKNDQHINSQHPDVLSYFNSKNLDPKSIISDEEFISNIIYNKFPLVSQDDLFLNSNIAITLILNGIVLSCLSFSRNFNHNSNEEIENMIPTAWLDSNIYPSMFLSPNGVTSSINISNVDNYSYLSYNDKNQNQNQNQNIAFGIQKFSFDDLYHMKYNKEDSIVISCFHATLINNKYALYLAPTLFNGPFLSYITKSDDFVSLTSRLLEYINYNETTWDSNWRLALVDPQTFSCFFLFQKSTDNTQEQQTLWETVLNFRNNSSFFCYFLAIIHYPSELSQSPYNRNKNKKSTFNSGIKLA